MAVLLVIGPIFEENLLSNQFGFRTDVDAKMAVRAAYFEVAQQGKLEVVDANLSDYFNTIPHGALMRCVSRRIADGTLLMSFLITQPIPKLALQRISQRASDRVSHY